MSEEQEGQKGQQSGLSQESSQKDRGPSKAEWIVGAIAAVLILGGIGFLVYQAWTRASLPPIVTVETKRILPQKARGYVVEFVARNDGGMTARGLAVEGRLLEGKGGKEVEKSSTTLTWVPAHAERQGGLFFSHNPSRYWLDIGPVGYERP